MPADTLTLSRLINNHTSERYGTGIKCKLVQFITLSTCAVGVKILEKAWFGGCWVAGFQTEILITLGGGGTHIPPLPMQATEAYKGIFPQMFTLLLALPIGTATVERSFSDMKLISKQDSETASRISVEGPKLEDVQENRHIIIYYDIN